MKKRSAKHLFSLLLLLTLLISVCLLASCEKPATSPDPEASAEVSSVPLDTLPPAPEQQGIVFFRDNDSEYGLILGSEDSTAGILNAANDLGDAINKYLLLGSGKHLFANRDTSETEEFEILLGNTNRPESAEVMSSLQENDFAVKVVGKKLVITGKGGTAATDGIRWFIDTFINDCDSLILPEDFCYIRSKAPTVLEMSQENLYWDLSTDTPEITVKLFSADASDPEVVSLVVDGHDITNQLSVEGRFVKISGIRFENGMHTAMLTMKSAQGDPGYEIFHFGTGECADMKLYKGEVHAHTTDSDGTGTAEQAYKYARDTAKLDFFAVTDHSNSYSEANFKAIHVPLANSFNDPGRFVALYGYEETYSYTSGYFGHLNTINSTIYAVKSEPLENYYKKMSRDDNAIVQFNHPGYSWGNFLEYDLYSEKYDKAVNLFEFKGSGYDDEWALCLAKGWHVSPMHNEDNHSGQWGTVNEAVGYVLAPSLTRQNITEAMSMNRSYTTTDQSLKIYFKINDVWMGGRLDNPETLNVSVHLKTTKTLGTVSIVAEDNIVVASVKPGSKRDYEWNLTLTPEYDYYYVKVDGGGFAVTAPVWVENRDKINITGMDRSIISYDNNTDKDHRISVAFKAEEAMTDVSVRFYQSALSGFSMETQECVSTVSIGNMTAGQTADAFADVAYVAASPRITAVVSGKIGDKTYTDTYYIQLAPLLFTEISASANGYSYVELYNATTEPIKLSNYKIRIWPKTGAKADALAEKTFTLSGTVQPHSVMVVWLRSNKSLTLANLNSKYGSSLTENKDVVAVATNWDAPLTRGVQIEILSGSTVVSRAQYNFGINTADVAECKSVTFTYQKDYTLTAVKDKMRQTPTPGTFDAGLMPALIDKAS